MAKKPGKATTAVATKPIDPFDQLGKQVAAMPNLAQRIEAERHMNALKSLLENPEG